jgi:hypothetical protein
LLKRSRQVRRVPRRLLSLSGESPAIAALLLPPGASQDGRRTSHRCPSRSGRHRRPAVGRTRSRTPEGSRPRVGPADEEAVEQTLPSPEPEFAPRAATCGHEETSGQDPHLIHRHFNAVLCDAVPDQSYSVVAMFCAGSFADIRAKSSRHPVDNWSHSFSTAFVHRRRPADPKESPV